MFEYQLSTRKTACFYVAGPTVELCAKSWVPVIQRNFNCTDVIHFDINSEAEWHANDR